MLFSGPYRLLFVLLTLMVTGFGQMPDHTMNGGDHASHDEKTKTLIDVIEHHTASGTSVEPSSTQTSMLMTTKGKWMLMFHGTAWVNATQQSGDRGGDKVFSTNWFMPMARRKTGSAGTLTFRAMFSLEPATVTGRRYPESFQMGETAFGKGITDGQHPHDFIMEIAAMYDHRLTPDTLLSFYVAPIGDPAMGPTAYGHRASAAEDPLAPLGHHMQDSTHIAADVLTAGVAYKAARIEFSGFHGREPDEFRWNIDQGALDSWSTRLTVNPARDWSGQYSFARLRSPEQLHPGEDIDRMTASLHYNHPWRDGSLAATLLWGRNSTTDGEIFNSYLAEATLRFRKRHSLWTRMELADRTTELLPPSDPASTTERFLGRVKAFTLGYDRDFSFLPRVKTAIGGQTTLYQTPDALKPYYGGHPVGVVLFVHFRL